jgi:NAD-dependent deacetylase
MEVHSLVTPTQRDNDGMQQAREWIEGASRIAALTGAGISAESGVPTFRGPEGLWRSFRPEELATPEAFARDPQLVWEWYDWRRGLIAGCSPNAGHRVLAACTVITQNVDGLHQRAGSESLIEIHGSIWRMRCVACQAVTMNYDAPLRPLPPLCGECGGMMRPGVVWFGEGLPPFAWEASVEAVSNVDVLLVVGTSGAVYPAAQLVPIAREAGAKVIEINPVETPLSGVADVVLRGKSGELLPLLFGGPGKMEKTN